MGPSLEWFDRAEAALRAGRLDAHAAALRDEGVPAARVALSLFAFFTRELRLRGRADDVARVLEAGPAVLRALGCPLERLERAVRERGLGRLVLALHDEEGWPKARIIAALMGYSVFLDARGADDEPVLAELDRLTGFAPREKHLWPNEPEGI